MRWLVLLLLLWAAPLLAEGWPDWQTTTITDRADLLDPATKARVVAQLEALKARSGTEMAVLTLDRQSDWQPDLTMEQFATGIFDRWGIGDATRNDGILVLVLREDRAMRIELGAGYDRYWDRTAETVVDDHFLPDFRRGDYAAGIEKGVAELIRAVADPFAARLPPPEPPHQGWMPQIAMAFMLCIFALPFLRHRIPPLRRCPGCGRRRLRVETQTLRTPTAAEPGEGERLTTCRHCDWSRRETYSMPESRPSDRSDFGGGQSGGGGASGRW